MEKVIKIFMNLGKKYESQEGCRYDVMRAMPPINQQSRLPSLTDADASLADAEAPSLAGAEDWIVYRVFIRYCVFSKDF